MKFLMAALMCFSCFGCGSFNGLVPNSRPISNQQLESDLVNQQVMVPSINGWRFEKGEMRCVNILQTDVGNERAVVVAEIVTTGNYAGPFIVVGISGKIEAFYSKIGDRWIIDKVENKGLETDYWIESGKRSGKSEEEVQAKIKAVCQRGYDNRQNTN